MHNLWMGPTVLRITIVSGFKKALHHCSKVTLLELGRIRPAQSPIEKLIVKTLDEISGTLSLHSFHRDFVLFSSNGSRSIKLKPSSHLRWTACGIRLGCEMHALQNVRFVAFSHKLSEDSALTDELFSDNYCQF